MTEQTTPAPAPSRAAANERQGFYLGLASAAFPAILAGVRLFVLTNGDDATMKALAQHTSMQALLIGSYVAFLPLILILGAALSLTERRAAMRGLDTQPTALATMPPPVALMLGAVGVVTAPLYLLIVLAVAGMLLVAALTVGRRWPSSPRWTSRPPSPLLGGRVPTVWVDVLTVSVGIVLAAVVVRQGMWLPATALTESGNTRVAYILSVDEDYETVLYRDGGGPQQIKSELIAFRQICSERRTGLLLRPLASLIFPNNIDTEGVPLCPRQTLPPFVNRSD